MIHITQEGQNGRYNVNKTVRVMQNSLLTLNLPGDTLSTDRMFLAFETLTLICVITYKRSNLLSILPFHHIIPWNELLIWIDYRSFESNPINTLIQKINKISMKESSRRLRLMNRYRNHLTWGHRNSVAHLHVLHEAYKLIKQFHPFNNNTAPRNLSY